ncbi:hypothetical protein PSPO01_09390 [Paraphaeosphaeria sporulosa]
MDAIASLQMLKDRLLDHKSEAPMHCLFLYDSGKYCTFDCSEYPGDHPRIFSKAIKRLAKEINDVSKPDFIDVSRAVFFCYTHDLKTLKTYRKHLEALWDDASSEMRSELWNGLHKRIHSIPLPATPRRNRPRPVNTNSAPSNIPSIDSHSEVGCIPSTVDMDIETPSRPQTAQAKLNTGISYSDDRTTPIPFRGYGGVTCNVDPFAVNQDSGDSEPRSLGQMDEDGGPLDCRSTTAAKRESLPRQDKEPRAQCVQEDTLPIDAGASGNPETKLNENHAQFTNPNAGSSADANTQTGSTFEIGTSIFGHINASTPSQEFSFSFEFSKLSLECETKIRNDPSLVRISEMSNVAGNRKGIQPLNNVLEHPAERSYQTIFEKLQIQDDRVDGNDTRATRSRSRSPAPPRQTVQDAQASVGLPVSELESEKIPRSTSARRISSEKTPRLPETGKIDSEAPLCGTGRSRHNKPSSAASEVPDAPRPQSSSSKDRATDEDKSKTTKSSPTCSIPSFTPTKKTRPNHGSSPPKKRGTQPFEIALKIKKLLAKSLMQTKKTGLVYVMEAPKFFSTFEPAASADELWLKIGLTTDLDQRLERIEEQCGIAEITAIGTSDLGCPMDLADRIEKLCHEQLAPFRRPFNCGSGRCPTEQHREWFAVEKDVAIRTMKLWKNFMDHKPYDADGKALSYPWRRSLADKEKFRLLEANGQESERDLLHRSLETWIRVTAEEQNVAGELSITAPLRLKPPLAFQDVIPTLFAGVLQKIIDGVDFSLLFSMISGSWKINLVSYNVVAVDENGVDDELKYFPIRIQLWAIETYLPMLPSGLCPVGDSGGRLRHLGKSRRLTNAAKLVRMQEMPYRDNDVL